jgi:hypothetical protein
LIGFLDLLEHSAPATYLRGSFVAYPLVNATHVLAIGALVTSALLMDLRIFGIGSSLPTRAVLGYLRPVAILALLVAVMTGILLFSVRPLEYVDNPAFRWKLVLVGAATANAVAFNLLPERISPLTRRALAALSLALWLAAVVAGRFIGFLA